MFQLFKRDTGLRVGMFVLALAMLVLSLPHICIFAAEETDDGTYTDSYTVQYLEITVPNSYIKLTSSMRDADPNWEVAHIENPSQTKDQYKTLNLVAAYYDKDSGVTVNFISKASSAFNVFDISDYDDEKMIEFAKTIVPQDEAVKAEVSAYKHPQMNMFRILCTFEGDNEDEELIYGTIVNGTLIQFSQDTKHIGCTTIRDDILQEFVSNVKLTRKLTYEEYQENQKKSLLVIGGFFGAGILLMVAFYVVNKIRQKQKKKRVQAISEKLFQFRKSKQAGEVDSTNLLFEVETEYDKNLLQTYCTYNAWFRNIKRDVVLAIIYVALVGYAVYLGSKVVLILGVAAAFLILYLRYSGCEKYCDNLIKRYELKKKKSITATYRFYNEYFTMSGIDSISEYIYSQIYRVSNYQGYMLLYISEENALVIDIEKVPEDKRIDFIRTILEKSRVE